MKRLILSTCMLFFLADSALGGMMTNQRWDFFDVELTTTTMLNPNINYNNHIEPETDNNPYGDPFISMYGEGLTHMMPINPGLMGDLQGNPSTMVITIPNSPFTDGWKWIEVEIGYMNYPGYAGPEAFEFQLITKPATTLISSGPMGTSSYDVNGMPFEELTWRFEVVPNPQSEMVGILFNHDLLQSASYFIDYVDVTTVCVPVPGAVLLGILGLGAAGIKLRKFA